MKEILPIIMDTTFTKLCVIDDYKSLIWTTRYYAVGDFELVVPLSDAVLNNVADNYYVMREDDDHVGIIEKIQIQRDEDNAETVIITGRFLSSIIGRRIVADQTQVNGKISDCVNQLLDDNITASATPSQRRINNFIYDNYSISQTIQAQYTGTNLLELIQDLAETYGLGFKTTLNDSNQFVFTMFEGVDRTYDQNTNTYAVFSDKYDNLKSSEYMVDHTHVVTAVLVAGEGEGTARKKTWAYSTIYGVKGINRREAFKDQRDMSNNDGEISNAEYFAQLTEAGQKSLQKPIQAFTGEVDFSNVVWKEDVNIGDICVIQNEKWGMYINSRLIEVIESVNEAGEYQIVPTFDV